MNYAIYNEDEHWVESPFFETKHETIDWITQQTGTFWDEVQNDDYYVQNFSEEEVKQIKSMPES